MTSSTSNTPEGRLVEEGMLDVEKVNMKKLKGG